MLEHSRSANSPEGGGAGGGDAAFLAGSARLPSIASMLSTVPDSTAVSAHQSPLPPCDSFDKPPVRRPGSLSDSLSPIAASPTSSRTISGSSSFPPVATADPATALEAGVALSEQDKPISVSPPTKFEITSVDFPDSNALHPLPSGLSTKAAINGTAPADAAAAAAVADSRSRSNSTSYPPVFDFPTTFGRPPPGHQGFAMSSERHGGTVGDERSALPSLYDLQSGVRPDELPSRTRALSISTTDEYRGHPAWHSQTSPLEPPQYSRQPLFGAGRKESADVLNLRRGSAGALGASRLPFVMEPSSSPAYDIDPLSSSSSRGAFPNFQQQQLQLQQQREQYHYQQQLPFPPPLPTSYSWAVPAHLLPLPQPPTASSSSNPHALASGLAASSPVSPPTNTNSSHAFPPTQPQHEQQQQQQQQQHIAVDQGWGALPGHPGPPPSGQLAVDLAYGVDNGGGESGEAGRYICPHCSKRFARPSSLRIHMHSHTGEKPFTCPLCDRAFSVQSNLRRHLKIHKGGTVQVGPSRRGDKLAREQQARAAAAGGSSMTSNGQQQSAMDVEGEYEEGGESASVGSEDGSG